MVTIRPIPRTEIQCNACGERIAYLVKDRPDGELVLEAPKDALGTFQRMRLYDVINDGEHLHDYEYEVDLCNDCTEKFVKIIKKFGLNKSQVKLMGADG